MFAPQRPGRRRLYRAPIASCACEHRARGGPRARAGPRQPLRRRRGAVHVRRQHVGLGGPPNVVQAIPYHDDHVHVRIANAAADALVPVRATCRAWEPWMSSVLGSAPLGRRRAGAGRSKPPRSTRPWPGAAASSSCPVSRGMGKTRLVEELAAHAVSQIRCVRCQGVQLGEQGAPPYWPWIQILGGLLASWSMRRPRGGPRRVLG